MRVIWDKKYTRGPYKNRFKCPECNERSLNIRTVSRKEYIYRRRECINEHRFATKEIYGSNKEEFYLEEDCDKAANWLEKRNGLY